MSDAPARERSAKADDKVTKAAPQVQRSNLWYHTSRLAMLVFCKVWFRVRFEHVERLPATGPVLLVANHASYLDPPLAGIGLRRPVAYLAQSGLGKFGPMKLWMRKVGVTLIDRDAPSTAALRAVSDCLKLGEVVGIFPEGTRSRDGRVGEFKSGVEFLVRRTGATVVPVGIEGAFRAMSRFMAWPRPRKVVVRYGEPRSAGEVLAPGGVEALRREVAALARAELAPVAATPAIDAKAVSATSASRSGTASVDPTASSSNASAGGGA